MTDIIDRDASKTSKGYRLQKLRAVELMLDSLASSETAYAYASIEIEGDVLIAEASQRGLKEYSEENKNYSKSSSFTLSSDEVKKSIVIFLDIYFAKHQSPELNFGFYTTNGIASEKQTKSLSEIGVTLGGDALLESLVNATFSDTQLEKIIKIVLHTYKAEYKNRPGNIREIESWSTARWRSFFSQIRWHFGSEDEIQLISRIDKKIRECKHYTTNHSGKEDLIRAAIIELFDERQSNKTPTARFVHGSDIALKFFHVAAGEIKRTDPVFKLWQELPPPDDKRNIKDKLLGISPSLDPKRIKLYAVDIATGALEQEEFAGDRHLLALKFRILKTCQERLLQLAPLIHAYSPQSNPEQVCDWISDLQIAAQETVADVSRAYAYPLETESFIRSLVLELFDSCYLHFDNDP